MFRRKVEASTEDSGMASKGGPATAAETKVAPIPRHLPLQYITLNFKQTTWEEIAPGNLYYLPIHQNPKYMFDQADINHFNKFSNTWHTMVIHAPHVKMSNLIMLQDDLRVQNNTPTDATAFTQVCYLMEYIPKSQKQYFKLGKLTKPDDLTDVEDLLYQLKPTKPENATASQFTTINGFSDFEQLTIHPAKANYTAGFIPGQTPRADPATHRILEPYIAPNAAGLLSQFSGNLNTDDEYFILPSYTETLARNQDKLNIYKYGDCIEYSINTNLDDVHLYNTVSNNFLAEQIITVRDGNTDYQYEGEFCWPSRNRPFLSRSNYFDNRTDPITEGKKFNTLQHRFYCMPPIMKPNGSLLGQRCSLMLEQTIAVTFYFNQATYMPDAEEDARQVSQDNAVILRRNFYPVPDSKPVVRSTLCPDGTKLVCKENLTGEQVWNLLFQQPNVDCYPDSFAGLWAYFIKNQQNLHKYVTFRRYDAGGGAPTIAYDCRGITTDNKNLRTEVLDLNSIYPNFKNYWIYRYNENGIIYLYWDPNDKNLQPPIEDIDGIYKWVYWNNNNTTSQPLVLQGTDVEFPNYINIDIKTMLNETFFTFSDNICVPDTMLSEEPKPKRQRCTEATLYTKHHAVANKTCKTFFT